MGKSNGVGELGGREWGELAVVKGKQAASYRRR